MSDTLYKGYVKTRNKKCAEKLKDRTDFKTLQDVEHLPEYAGVLADDTILIDIDDKEQSETLMDIVEDLQLDCKVIDTSRGKHFLFKNTDVNKCHQHCTLAIGLTADIKVGSRTSYEVLKVDGEDRFVEWDSADGKTYQELPRWLIPVRGKADFLDMKAGDGRNQKLFNYILTLSSNGFSKDESRECIRIINRYILKDPLSDDELATVLRDDAFKTPAFFINNTFQFADFARYLMTTRNIVRTDSLLYIYERGVYAPDYRELEKAMIELVPNLRKQQRNEVLNYLPLITEEIQPSSANYIAFRNGVLDINDGDNLLPFSPSCVVTNKIPWNYNPSAYDKTMDDFLNSIACYDKNVRSLLEECVGYCLYRQNNLRKAFILVGTKRNGKSTFLDCVKAALGRPNYSPLDLSELSDRFSTFMMVGKLANIGDDIGDDFLVGSQVANFKKIVAGNTIKVEQKGLDPIDYEPYVKLLFSANRIPRMKDKTGAVLDRLIIIPFEAEFAEDDPDTDVKILEKLIQPGPMEYLLKLGVEGLRRILEHGRFTSSEKVDQELQAYREENNPIDAFIADHEVNDFLHEQTIDVYRMYTTFCADNNMQPMGNIAFSRELCKRLNMETVVKKIKGKTQRIFEIYR